MNSKLKIALALLGGILLGAGGQVVAGKWAHTRAFRKTEALQATSKNSGPSNTEEVMQQAWKQFDRSMAEERQAMQKLFAAQIPDFNSSWPSQDQGEVREEPDKVVIRVPIQDPHHEIHVKAKDGFLTVTEQADNKNKDEISDFDSVQSFSISPGYDTSRMKQDMEGQALVISIPKASS